MVIITSQQIQDMESSLQTYVFDSGIVDVKVVTISATMLNSESAALLFAEAAFLAANYTSQTVDITVPAAALEIGDIITLNLPDYNVPINQINNRFKVVAVIQTIKGTEAITKLKVVRYD